MIEVPDFDAVYRADPDPWQVTSSFYEQRKQAVVLASLTRPTYASAWDPAAGTGALAARLAERADAVLATDSSVEAVRLSSRRCAGLPNVEVAQLSQPERPERDGFDLVVVAEFAYYLSAEARTDMWKVLSDVAAPTAELLAVHWRHRPHDGYLSGADVQAEAADRLTQDGWRTVVRHDDQDFVLDVLRRDPS